MFQRKRPSRSRFYEPMPELPPKRLAPPPPPSPRVARAQSVAMADLSAAVGRASAAWSESQMIDALRSVRYWLEQAERELNAAPNNDPHPRPQA
ncbi:hypothetical protein [Burkholderia gladioli]|uniref:hypothetical protein n=1 Tax=Burkholderia gladioli TaxID=28095 RepID=UPI001641DEA3|nr:hypothetical protein [Burkholderia gladioli]